MFASPKAKMVYSFVINNPGCKSGDIAAILDIPKQQSSEL